MSNRDKAGRKLPTSNESNTAGPVYADRLTRYIKTVRLDSLNAIREHFDRLAQPAWVFRGQADSRWYLTTSLERYASSTHSSTFRPARFVSSLELGLLNAFKSRAHLYTSVTAPHDDDLEWVALMQHHGCPTRLLDFTRSPYVALYFAIETVSRDRSCAVWAINSDACNERSVHRIQALQEWNKEQILSEEDLSGRNVAGKLSSARLFRRAFLSNQFTLVCTVQPARHNTRMASQQGCFLCPGTVEMYSFEENLLQQLILGIDPEHFIPVWNPPQIYRFTIPSGLRGEILRELRRMNITRATLFPGLDGFAKSLPFELDVPS